MKTWTTYSVFISSTFSDMQSERDYLNNIVFPRLNQAIKPMCVTLKVIDLRWGIHTPGLSEECIEEKVMNVCLDEIERCRPFFIGLLGLRYGTIFPSMPFCCRNRGVNIAGSSITTMEIEYGSLNRNEINGCLFMERDSSVYEQLEDNIKEKYVDKDSQEKLSMLKTKIKSKLKSLGKEDCYHIYRPRWKDGMFCDLDEFGEYIFQIMLREIENQVQNNVDNLPFSAENRRQNGYLYNRLSCACRRSCIIDKYEEVVQANYGGLIIKGTSGSGKSYSYALLVEFLQKRNVDGIILYHTTSTGIE